MVEFSKTYPNIPMHLLFTSLLAPASSTKFYSVFFGFFPNNSEESWFCNLPLEGVFRLDFYSGDAAKGTLSIQSFHLIYSFLNTADTG